MSDQSSPNTSPEEHSSSPYKENVGTATQSSPAIPQSDTTIESIMEPNSHSGLDRDLDNEYESQPQDRDEDIFSEDDLDYTTPSSSSSSGSRRSSLSSVYPEESDLFIPLDKITVFDFLQNLDLPHKIERWQEKLQAQTKRVKEQQAKLKNRSLSAKDKVLKELKKRTPDEQLVKYRQRMHKAVDRLGDRWNDVTTVTAREKISFVCGVLNIFICGLLIGGYPTWFHIWYTAQLVILMPARYISYHKIGYHYFLADMCYFVNLLAMLSIWCFPGSKRLFISTFSLAFGNNAIAIALWRNSLVFHSLDKVTSVSIHLLPPATLHCLTHLTPTEILKERFPAIHHIKFSPSDSPDHYGLASMMLWSTVPYAIWQLAYYFLINVRRADKIAAGRPTSFTWLKKSYAKTAIGKAVLSLPESLQEAAFMTIQYTYALLTIIPCPLWFWYKHASSAFLFVVFTWGVYNGATFYIDVFGNRFRKELDQLKREVAKWQNDSLQVENGQGVQTVPRSPASAPADAKKSEEIEKKDDLSSMPPLDKKADSAPDGSTSTGVEGHQGPQRDQENQEEGVRNRTAIGTSTSGDQ